MCSDWRIGCTFSGSNRAAIGSMLLRSPDSNNPLQ
jgi:hypothetical protein